MRNLNFEFENFNGLHLIVTSTPATEFSHINHFELNMLKQNKLEYFMSCEVEVIDNEYKFHYPVQNVKKLKHYMQINCTNQANLYQFSVQLIDALNESYSNLLTPDGCIIHGDAIFYDESKQKIMLTYFPTQQKHPLSNSFLQWFLDWTKQITIDDYEHLHMVLTLCLSTQFSLEHIQQAMMSYLYEQQIISKVGDTALLTPPPVTTKKSPLNFTNEHTEKLNRAEQTNEEINKSLPIQSSKEILGFVEEDEIEEVQQNKSKLRPVLVTILLSCLPLWCWINLYTEKETLTNLLICCGASLVALALSVYLWFKPKLFIAKKEKWSEVESTEDQLLPFSILEGIQFKVDAAKEDKLDVTPMPKNKPQIAKHLDTVALSAQDYTVQVNGGNSFFILKRAYQQAEQSYPLNETIIVGRSIDGVHINEEYSGASRLHIQFERNDEVIIVKDLGSKNGSFLNGVKMMPYKNYMLSEKDRIQLVDEHGPYYYISSSYS